MTCKASQGSCQNLVGFTKSRYFKGKHLADNRHVGPADRSAVLIERSSARAIPQNPPRKLINTTSLALSFDQLVKSDSRSAGPKPKIADLMALSRFRHRSRHEPAAQVPIGRGSAPLAALRHRQRRDLARRPAHGAAAHPGAERAARRPDPLLRPRAGAPAADAHGLC